LAAPPELDQCEVTEISSMNYAPRSFAPLDWQLASSQKVAEGRLLGIATRPAPKAPMSEVLNARITTERGVNNDKRGKPGTRQVTVLTRKSWEAACAELGADGLWWTTRRANLLIDGIELKNKVGWDLQIGDAILTITGETRPCKRMDEAHPGLMKALQADWRAGVTCRVIRTGDVMVGCEVVLSRNIARQLARIVYLRSRKLLKAGRSSAAGVARRLGLKR
jgi:MOSC domain-containing protein YiiM